MIPDYHHQRPYRKEFYDQLRALLLQAREPLNRIRLPHETGIAIDVRGGEFLEIVLPEGAQIVNLFAYNPHDPDERFWAHNTSSVEGAFLRRHSRLWGTMARFRPLLTVIDDTVVTQPTVGAVSGKHHFVIGGWGTPADWVARGGPAGVASTWERLTDAIRSRGLPASLLKDDACLFQKTVVDPRSQVQVVLPSDATTGDRFALFAEMDLVLVLALSPYREGGAPPRELDGSVRPVDFLTYGIVADPLGWPYEEVPYPDLSLYLNSEGTRSDVPAPTRGLE